jgi:hypothetical protein
MKISRLTRAIVACLLACTSVVATSAAFGASQYDIAITGLTDAEHTRDDGYQFSSNSYRLNEAGQVLGRSTRYNSGATNLGQTAWLYSNGLTTNIGLVDAEHTISGGVRHSLGTQLNAAGQAIGTSSRGSGGQSIWFYNGITTSKISLGGTLHTSSTSAQSSNPAKLNENGQVTGTTFQYNGGTDAWGASAWLYSGGTTTQIGLMDAEHTRSGGFQNNGIMSLNESGQVLGSTGRFNGGTTQLGNTYWIYTGSSTTPIGLTGAAYTRDDGFKQTTPIFIDGLNEAGQVVGMSTRFDGTATAKGFSAWFYNAGTTTDISLTDAEHSRDDGSYSSRIEPFTSFKQFNQAGQVLGTSDRFNGGTTNLGRTAWLYNGNDASRVTLGFDDAMHTSSTGAQFSTGQILNENGHVAGASTRYNGGAAYAGTTAWLYSSGTTTSIGLADAEHIRNDGRQDSTPQRLNEAGQVAGRATRYNGTDGSVYLGESIWMYDGSSTTKVNPTGTTFTRDDGRQSHQLLSLNEVGQITGYSQRFNGTDGSVILGQSAWFYDSTIDQTYSMDLSTRSDGYAYSTFSFLSDAGFALGYYELFDTDDSLLGNRAIYFSPDDGWLELGSLVDGGLTAAGWDYLADAILANGADQIIGAGLLDGMTDGQMTYLMTPQAVPVPGAVWLFGSGLLGLIGIARRKKAA